MESRDWSSDVCSSDLFVSQSRYVCVKELPGKHTYKIAVTVAKALMQEVEGEEIVAVIESWKLYPNENEKKTNKNNLDGE